MLVQSHGHSRRNVSELPNSSQSPKVLQMSKSLSTFPARGIEAANSSWGQVTATFNLKTSWHAMWYKPKLLWGRIPQATTTTTSLGKLQRNTNTQAHFKMYFSSLHSGWKKKIFFDQIFLRRPSPRKAILKYTWVTFCSLEWKNKHDWLIKGSGLAFLQEREYPVIAEKTCHHGVLPPQVCSSQCILVYSVCLSGNRHCYAFQIVTSCKIKHVQLKNSSPWGCREKRSRASRQSHRFWKWVLIKFQTS